MMDKKIIVVGIVGMFLLTGLMTVSAVEMKASESKSVSKANPVVASSDDLPDLTIEFKIIPLLLNYVIKAKIHNEGTSEVPAGSNIVVKMIFEDTYTYTMWTFYPVEKPFKPGDIINWPHFFTTITASKILDAGKTLTIIVDPVWEEDYPWPELNPDPVYGLIQESNEDNNIDTVTLPTSVPVSYSQSNSQPQQSNTLFFQILQRLMNIR